MGGNFQDPNSTLSEIQTGTIEEVLERLKAYWVAAPELPAGGYFNYSHLLMDTVLLAKTFDLDFAQVIGQVVAIWQNSSVMADPGAPIAEGPTSLQ